MPEITPELIRKHFKCAPGEPWEETRWLYWSELLDEVNLYPMDWLVRFCHLDSLHAQWKVEDLILRLDAAEKRIEELEAELTEARVTVKEEAEEVEALERRVTELNERIEELEETAMKWMPKERKASR